MSDFITIVKSISGASILNWIILFFGFFVILKYAGVFMDWMTLQNKSRIEDSNKYIEDRFNQLEIRFNKIEDSIQNLQSIVSLVNDIKENWQHLEMLVDTIDELKEVKVIIFTQIDYIHKAFKSNFSNGGSMTKAVESYRLFESELYDKLNDLTLTQQRRLIVNALIKLLCDDITGMMSELKSMNSNVYKPSAIDGWMLDLKNLTNYALVSYNNYQTFGEDEIYDALSKHLELSRKRIIKKW